MANLVCSKLSEKIKNCHLPSYIYGYPSKRTYKKFDAPINLSEVWSNQSGNLNLYIHIPFCNYKCTYCTLLSAKINDNILQESYIASLLNEITEYSKVAGYMKLDSIYFGGGTPTLLSNDQLEILINTITTKFPNRSANMEIAIEGSPETMDIGKLGLLKRLGVNRISMGVQTFNPEELKKTGRPYPMDVAIQAINNIKEMNFKNFNLDLIYGLENQTKESWLSSLEKVISFSPNSINLYPVVIRPLAGINQSKQLNKDKFMEDDSKYELYDISVAYMRENGYRQETFVSFTNLDEDGYKQQVSDFQGNPLIGIGVGARSYTETIHYSTDYVVTQSSTINIIKDYIDKGFENLIQNGFKLDTDEQKRRYIILNLLINKLNYSAYEKKFGSEMLEEFTDEFAAIEEEGCIEIDRDDGTIILTDKGFKYSSIIGSLFESEKVKNLINSFKDK
jgi:oxygen-independent coproporphyrinogen-3 oxidase